MLNRLIRVFVGIVFLITIPFTIIPLLLLWVITDNFYINNIMN